MAINLEEGLHRLSEDEILLIYNYRRSSTVRQEAILYFSEEMSKQTSLDRKRSCKVIPLVSRR